MAVENKVMTAPLAVLKVGNTPIAKCRSIRVTESFRLDDVTEMGRITPDQFVITKWDGSCSIGFFMLELKNQAIPGSILRNVQTPDQFVDTLILNDSGVQLDIYRKVKDVRDPQTGIITPKLSLFASIGGMFATREGFDITDGAISGRDLEFRYLSPILFSV
jgi:hypothetical protein